VKTDCNGAVMMEQTDIGLQTDGRQLKYRALRYAHHAVKQAQQSLKI